MKNLTKKAQDMSDDGATRLLGAIIRQGIKDMFCDIDAVIEKSKQTLLKKNAKKGIYELTKDQKSTLQTQYNQMLQHKENAKWFFAKSDLFKASGVSLDYLLAHKDEILNSKDKD